MAYALESVIQILKHDSYHLDLHIELQNQIKPLLLKSLDLRDLVQRISFPNVMPENLARRVRDGVHKIEDVIEINIINQTHSDVDFEIELACIIEEFDSIEEELMMLNIVDENTSDPLSDRLQEVDPSRRDDVVVGFGGYQNQLREIFEKESPELRIISIVGKAGLGKTTLAQKFCRSGIIKQFARHAWVTISQEYNMQATLLSVLGSLRKIEEYMRILKVGQLGALVHNTLKGCKYLVVLDDIWDIRAWDQLRKFFPDDCNGSGIILTTRNSTVAHYASSLINVVELGPLSEYQSLRLLRMKVHRYRDDPYHPGYGYVAAYIARTCQGYPLAITFMAGLLTTSTNMGDSWEYMFGAISKYIEVATNDDDINEVVLSLCYNHLHDWLKPCFLNIGAFPEDYEIRASIVTKLWIAEGFIRSFEERDLEDTAEAYLKAIIDRNLFIVSQKEPNGNAKTFKVHDVVRDFCLKKSLEEKFLWSEEDPIGSNFLMKEEKIRRISAHIQPDRKKRQQLSLARSFLCIGRASLYLAPMFLCLRFLKILDVFQVEFYQFPTEILQMGLLKFLALSCHSTLPSSISRLRNLQTLIMRRLPSFRAFVLPSPLWELVQLRHLKSNKTCVLYSPGGGELVLENLRTLSNVQTLGFTNEFLRTVPNLRKLGIFCNTAMGTVIKLSCLDKLEMLKCSSDWSLASHSFLSHLTFPSSLRKLTLSFCKIPGGFMRIIGSLPNLEEFKVLNSDFLAIDTTGRPKTPSWKTNEGEFVELLSLHMEDLNLVIWDVNETSFVKLQFLTVKSCSLMASGIPLGIGIKNKSMRIEVDKSCPLLLASALQMQEKYKVRVHISRNQS